MIPPSFSLSSVTTLQKDSDLALSDRFFHRTVAKEGILSAQGYKVAPAAFWYEKAVAQKEYSMKTRSLLLPLVLGFGTLVVLIGILGVGAIRRARAIYNEMETTRTHICNQNPPTWGRHRHRHVPGRHPGPGLPARSVTTECAAAAAAVARNSQLAPTAPGSVAATHR